MLLYLPALANLQDGLMSDSVCSASPTNPPCPATQVLARVVEQEQMARNTYRLRLHCPEIAKQIIPGQFFMVRPPIGTNPLLGRPFALFDTYDDPSGQPTDLDFGYVTVGKLTGLMPSWKVGQEVSLWGPLGNGFPIVPTDTRHVMFVAGGIGQTPFLAVAKEVLGLRQYGRRVAPRTNRTIPTVTLCYGARSADYLAGLDQFAMEGLDIRLATDDGSRGHHGFVTELLKQSLASNSPPDLIYCCGPEPMMHAVQKLARAADVPCWLSLETPMACGIGICFSCVAKIQQDDGEWDYRRTCLEGPVFPATKVVF